MEKILFVNACVRKESRTMRLAKHLLSKLEGNVEELNLVKEDIPVINNWNSLQNRYSLLKAGKMDAPELKLHANLLLQIQLYLPHLTGIWLFLP